MPLGRTRKLIKVTILSFQFLAGDISYMYVYVCMSWPVVYVANFVYIFFLQLEQRVDCTINKMDMDLRYVQVLSYSRRSQIYLGQATSTVQDRARDNSCYVTL